MYSGLQPKYLRDQFVYQSDIANMFKTKKQQYTIIILMLPVPRNDYTTVLEKKVFSIVGQK